MGLGSSPERDIKLNTVLCPEDRAKYQDSRLIQSILRDPLTIAIVGLSTEKTKASNMVANYLQVAGYRVIPVHPKATEILGEKAYRSLLDIPVQVDVVNVFRPAEEVSGIVDDAIAIGAKVVWTQLRIVDLAAAEKATAAGLDVVMDRCIKMEHGRYGGMLHWGGMNTEIVSAKRLS